MSPERKALIRAACERVGIELASPYDIPGFRPPVRDEATEVLESCKTPRVGRAQKYDRAAITAAILERKSMREIATQFGCSRDVVRAVAKNSNLMHLYAPKPKQPRKSRAKKFKEHTSDGRPVKWDREQIRKLHEEGLSSYKIAERTGAAASTVRDIIRKLSSDKSTTNSNGN